MARLVRAATDRNPPTSGGGGCQQKDELGFWNGKKFCTFEQNATEYFGPIPEPREPKE